MVLHNFIRPALRCLTVYRVVLLLLLISVPVSIPAEVPEKFHVQVTVRDFNNILYVNQTLGARIRIVSQSSKVYYTERQVVQTNARGLANIEVGSGTDQVGSILDVPWDKGPDELYVRTEFDPKGGTSYTVFIHTRIASVPLAMNARYVGLLNESDSIFQGSAASSIAGEDIGRWDNATKLRHFPGEQIGGGVIFYVDKTGENGLLATPFDIHDSIVWMDTPAGISGAGSFANGPQNTLAIVQQLGAGEHAAYLADTLHLNGKADWYLPSSDELSLLFDSRYEVNKALGSDDDPQNTGIHADAYWSSTQRDNTTSYVFNQGSGFYFPKDSTAALRAVRKFKGLYDVNNCFYTYLGGPEKELGNPPEIIDNPGGDIYIDYDGKRGTVFRPLPEMELPVKITFNFQTKFDPGTSEPPTELFGTGDFRLYFGCTHKAEPLDTMHEGNLGEFEGVQFRIHPHLDESPIRRYTGTESHTCTSIWLRKIDPDKRTDGDGNPITGLISDECQRRGNQCGWSRVGLFENGFGLENEEETEISIIISYSSISIETNGRKWTVLVEDIEKDNDYEGDIFRFDRITNFAVDHTNTSRGYETLRISNMKIFPLE